MKNKLYVVSAGTKPGMDVAKNGAWKPEEYEKWLKPLYLGLLDKHGGCGTSTHSNGDTMRIFLKFEEDRVIQATFKMGGSEANSICAFYAAQLALGKSPDELEEITDETIMEMMGGLPEEDRQCAFLAAESVRKALQHYRMKQGTGNKRSFRGI